MSEVEDIYGLAPMQQLMLFDSLFLDESAMYRVQNIYRLTGVLDIAAFERAWNKAVSRNPIMRTSFHWEDMDKPVQVVHRDVLLPLEQYDWSGESEAEQEKHLEEFIDKDKRNPVKLDRPPLMRLVLIHLGAQHSVFLWSFQHILIEGWSASVILDEVFSCYKAYSTGSTPLLADKPPYHNYINWLAQQDYTKAETFWKNQLSGFEPPPAIGIDRSPGTDNTQLIEYATERIDLSIETTRALNDFAQGHALTMNTVVQSAWALLLSRYMGCDDVMFGVLVAGRSAPVTDIGSIVGLCVNILPMRIRIDENESLLSFLKQQQLKQLDIQQYEFVSLADIKRWCGSRNDAAIFETLFIFENWAGDASMDGLGDKVKVEDRKGAQHGQGYPISMVVVPGEQLAIGVSYDFSRFDKSEICVMLEHFLNILEGFVAEPQQSLKLLPILSSSESQRLLIEWNSSKRDYPRNLCVHELFETQVERTPDAVAVTMGDQQLSYRELDEKSNQLANYLTEHGAGPDVLVGILLNRSIDMMIGILGILKSGAAYVPLDPAYPRHRLAYMLKDSKLQLLVSKGKLADLLPQNEARVVCIDSDGLAINESSSKKPLVEIKAANLAYVIYTSGSTGKPKGVMIEHAALVNYVQTACVEFALKPDDRILQFATISFDTAAEEIFPCLAQGATLVLRTDSILDSAPEFLKKCQDLKLTVLDLPTAYWQEIVANLGVANLALPSSLRLVIIGGERASPESLAIWCQQVEKNIRLVNTYGPTEATIVATMCDLSSEDALLNELPIGRPVSNVQAYLLDKHRQPVPTGIPGEIHIAGAGLARGYLNHPELTHDTFITNPFDSNPEARLYKTGDLARYLPDGRIQYLGRIDHQVKIRGFRVETGEIETLLSQHQGVRESVVILRDDNPGDKRLIAYYVAVTEFSPTPVELRRYLQDELPEYMIPSAFVLLERLPMSPNHKIDRDLLPAPEAERQLEAIYAAPGDVTEQKVALIWEEVLKVEKIGIHDNFFDLGGHSLLILHLHNKIREEFETDVPIVQLFEHPTIYALARHLSQGAEKQASLTDASRRAQKQKSAVERRKQSQQRHMRLRESTRKIRNGR